jgi:hypothetical protein
MRRRSGDRAPQSVAPGVWPMCPKKSLGIEKTQSAARNRAYKYSRPRDSRCRGHCPKFGRQSEKLVFLA